MKQNLDDVALKEERQKCILDVLEREGRVLASDLCAKYMVSKDTIRRDLREMAEAGAIQRVHGGALRHDAGSAPYVRRQEIDIESKSRIARAAAHLIHDGQVVLIDGGTTTVQIASHLSKGCTATVITNSPPLALALADHPRLSVRLLGGSFLKDARLTVGIDTIKMIEFIRADLCLLGMCSLHPDAGITVNDFEEAHVKRAMVRASDEVVGLISGGKLGTVLPYVVGPASQLTHLITDSSCEEFVNPYRAQGIGITIT